MVKPTSVMTWSIFLGVLVDVGEPHVVPRFVAAAHLLATGHGGEVFGMTLRDRSRRMVMNSWWWS